MGCAPLDPTADQGYDSSRLVAVQAIPAYDATLEPFDILGTANVTTDTNVWHVVATYTPGAGRRGFLHAFGIDFSDARAWQETEVMVSWGSPGPHGGVIGGGGQTYRNFREGFCGFMPHENCPFQTHIAPSKVVVLSVRNVSGTRTFTAWGRLRGLSTCAGAKEIG